MSWQPDHIHVFIHEVYPDLCSHIEPGQQCMWQKGLTDLQTLNELQMTCGGKKGGGTENADIISGKCFVCSFIWAIAPVRLLYNNHGAECSN